jgi:hypothetical protein
MDGNPMGAGLGWNQQDMAGFAPHLEYSHPKTSLVRAAVARTRLLCQAS